MSCPGLWGVWGQLRPGRGLRRRSGGRGEPGSCQLRGRYSAGGGLTLCLLASPHWGCSVGLKGMKT